MVSGEPWGALGGRATPNAIPNRPPVIMDDVPPTMTKYEEIQARLQAHKAGQESPQHTKACTETTRADAAAVRDDGACARQNTMHRQTASRLPDEGTTDTPNIGPEDVRMHHLEERRPHLTGPDNLPIGDGTQSHLSHDKPERETERETRAEREAVQEDFRGIGDHSLQTEERKAPISRKERRERERERERERKLEKPTGGASGPRSSRVSERFDKSEKYSEKSSENRFSSLIKSVCGYTSPEQERDFWKAKCDEEKQKYAELNWYFQQEETRAKDLEAKLKKEKDESHRLREDYESISRVRDEFQKKFHYNKGLYEDADRRANNLQKELVMASEEHLIERSQLKTQIDELYKSHIRSVNTVGTGLDPISDDTISKKFTDLSDEINSWCRRAFKGKPAVVRLDELEPTAREMKLDRLLASRTFDTNTISYSRLIETITWGYIERAIFAAWFPRMGPTYAEPICTLQDWIAGGDKSAQKERKEFWRAYTCSLLFQNSDVAASLQAVGGYETVLAQLYELVQRERKGLSEPQLEALRERLQKAVLLAAELRCQRGAYEIEEDIQLGDPYDETRMDDVGFTVETCKDAAVLCILSKGLVRRPFAGSDMVDSRVYKARVLVVEGRRLRRGSGDVS